MATTSGNVAAVVLAAGQGKRMRSSVPKVLHAAGGRPLLGHVLAALGGLALDRPPVVVSSPAVKSAVETGGWAPEATCVVQDPPRGTADAVRVGLEAAGISDGTVLVAQGGTPLIRSQTFAALVDTHFASGAAATVLTALVPDPYGYGRVVRDVAGDIERIVEERDATEGQRSIQEINGGAYVFDAVRLQAMLDEVDRVNDQGEYYLPDVIGLLRAGGQAIASHHTTGEEILGVKSLVHLAEVASVLRSRICARWMAEGVTVVDPSTTFIDASVQLEPDVVVYPFTLLEGRTVARSGATLGPQTRVVDSEVGPRATVSYAVVVGSEIGPEASVGPFASLRPGTKLGRAAKVGTFVETKATTIGDGSKAPHLSYLGDADLGNRVNVGAGTITCNWDGRSKHRTVIDDEAYISSDTMLVAPVHIGRRAATGAGAVVRADVPEDALAVGVPARVIEGAGNRMGRRSDAPPQATHE